MSYEQCEQKYSRLANLDLLVKRSMESEDRILCYISCTLNLFINSLPSQIESMNFAIV